MEPDRDSFDDGTAGLSDSSDSGPVTESLEEPGAPAPAQGGVFAGRYELRNILGQGGMGRVWQAFDRVLAREVAVKLLHAEGEAATRRLLREARVQARVNHDNVCRVFDAGVVGGTAYVSMQLIAGPSLRQAAGSLTRAEKLQVVAQAAEGVHAAHRTGLVHRDLKPGNIMLERQPDGGWKAFVVDFGLVRELEGASETIDSIAGTPQYMAPEQVRGESERIDWRTDVYALGATLFELVTGEPVVQASTPVDALLKVLREDISFPAEIRVPRDLQAVIGRCLEKEPERRYGSARELAEELHRLLAGQPVLARPIGALGRARRAIRRRPRTAAAAAAALVALVALSGLWAAAVVRGRAQAALARRFGEQAAGIDAALRYSALLPPHDVRPERRALRERMAAIERDIERIGDLAVGPGRHALGRGWLSLGDPERARRELERAWAAGYREADVACALGQALSEMYRQQIDQVRALASPALRRRREEQLDAELRRPAIGYLQSATGALAVPAAYRDALVASLEEREEEAIAAARAAALDSPWLVEATLLEVRLWFERSQRARAGGDLEVARAALDQAGLVLAAAIDTARSAADSRRLESARRRQLIEIEGLAGRDPAPLQPAVEQAVEQALALDADDPGPLLDRALAWWRIGEFAMQHGADPRPALDHAIRNAEATLSCDPDSPRAAEAIGLACWRLGEYAEDTGDVGGAEEWLRRSVAAFELAIGLDPLSPGPYGNRGSALRALAKYESGDDRHPDVRPALVRSLESFDLAILLEPGLASGYYNRAVTAWSLALYERQHGLDPRASLNGAIADYRTALGINPALRPALNAIGAVYADLGRYEDAQGRNPRPAWDEAERWCGQAIAERRDVLNAAFNLSLLLRDRARHASRTGDDAVPILLRAREAIAHALASAPDRNWVYREAGQVELALATALRPAGDRELSEAARLLARSRRMNPEDGNVAVALARVHVERAERAAARGASPVAELERALTEVTIAERLLEGTGSAPRIRGEVLLARSRLGSAARALADARAALAAFSSAIEVNANLAVELAPLVAEARARAGGGL